MTIPNEPELSTQNHTVDERARPRRTRPGRVLVVDDEPEIRRLVQEILEDEHYQVVTAENAAAARERYRDQRPDLVLLDIWMPDTDGITLLKEWSKAGSLEIPVIMMSGHGTVETAVEATRLGAYDFIEKPVSMGRLLVTIERALESEVLRRENLRLRGQAEPPAFLVGKSRVMQKLREDIERVAATDTWVLISGEQGGRAQAARFLHHHSARREQPIIEVSLAAVSTQDISMRLFGTETDGMVTPGSFEQANGGALVLSEIGELDNASQAQLLNVLEEKKFFRIGGHQPVVVDVRIIALTSKNLPQAIREGGFREDLYYRLNVVPLHIPPLREHCEDVPELVSFYLDWLVDHEQLSYRRFSTAALNGLRNHPWPGNVRELKNVVQRLLILNRDAEVTEAEAEQALGSTPAPLPVTIDTGTPTLFDQPLRSARDQFEKAYLEYHLARTGGNVAEVARLSEMERTHLYRKLKHLGVNPKSVKE
jgi:two-component system, NtrC family, nitrogen regulation response regulator NtrX